MGALRIASLLAGRSPRILMYHRFARRSDGRRVGADDLEVQAKILRDNSFNVVTMKELCARLEVGRPVEPRTVVITVDDGYEDFYTWAYPVFAKYELPVTVYVTTDFVDRKIWLWPDLIEYLLATAARGELALQMGGARKAYSLHTEEQRRNAWSDIGSYCLSVSNSEKQAVIRQLGEELQVSVPVVPVEEYGAMSWEQLREMNSHGIDVGGHTLTHPVLTSLSRSEAEAEIRGSKARIEDRLSRAADSFAYPNGSRGDYDEGIKALVRAAGYKNAAVAFADSNITADLFELRRYPVGAGVRRFKNVVYGLEYLSMCMGRRG
jgi:peptidoglycan/xylan/chitin deacetylase (PgdA/CDA1 family)